MIYADYRHCAHAAQASANKRGCRIVIYKRVGYLGTDYLYREGSLGLHQYFPGGKECWRFVESVLPNNLESRIREGK